MRESREAGAENAGAFPLGKPAHGGDVESDKLRERGAKGRSDGFVFLDPRLGQEVARFLACQGKREMGRVVLAEPIRSWSNLERLRTYLCL